MGDPGTLGKSSYKAVVDLVTSLIVATRRRWAVCMFFFGLMPLSASLTATLGIPRPAVTSDYTRTGHRTHTHAHIRTHTPPNAGMQRLRLSRWPMLQRRLLLQPRLHGSDVQLQPPHPQHHRRLCSTTPATLTATHRASLPGVWVVPGWRRWEACCMDPVGSVLVLHTDARLWPSAALVSRHSR